LSAVINNLSRLREAIASAWGVSTTADDDLIYVWRKDKRLHSVGCLAAKPTDKVDWCAVPLTRWVRAREIGDRQNVPVALYVAIDDIRFAAAIFTPQSGVGFAARPHTGVGAVIFISIDEFKTPVAKTSNS